MKAAVLHEPGGPEALRLDDVREPRPGATQVLVKIAACGMCGHDQSDRAGLTKIPMPVVLGHEVSGTVVDVGSHVAHFKVGDQVASKQFTTCGWCRNCLSGSDVECEQRFFNYGGFAEYVALEERSILPVPGGLDLIEASIIACALGSCVHALRQIARVVAGETVVVTGAGGGLGVHGLQYAKALGARTIAITTSPEKIERLHAIGADEVVLGQGDEYWKEILASNGGEPVEVVLDNVGHPDVFNPCFRALARRGRYVFTGQVARRKVEFYPAFVFGKEAMITGSGSTRAYEFMDALESARAGDVRPVIERFPLDEVVEAWRRMDAGTITGRAVLVP
jgi:D-arabinose 1-dehydrogenase-like Zn-dependent alcohol dehydrogenase